MDILFIVPYVPNLIRVRPYNLIRSLTRRGHRVTVATLSTDDETDIEQLERVCYLVHSCRLPSWRSAYNALVALPTRVPLQAVYCWQPWLAEHIVELADKKNGESCFDIVHVEHLRGAKYGLYLKYHLDGSCLKPPIIWDSVDCITYLFAQAATHSKKKMNRWLSWFDLARTEWYESYLVSQFDHILVTSQVDKDALRALAPSGSDTRHISVLPNGVDLDYFVPDENVPREEATVVVSGKMSYHANVTMVLYLVNEIMPLVWIRKPEVKLWVVGKDPSKEIKALEQHPMVTVTGTLNDIRPFLRAATLAVTPIQYGAGVQNKVLEAMACAAPVISTPQAISALSVQPGRDMLIANEPGEFAEKILNLLLDPEAQRRFSQAGRQYVESHHNWDMIAGQLEQIYSKTIYLKNHGTYTEN